MARLRVIHKFRDKTNPSRLFSVGEIITIDDEARVRNITEQKLAVVIPDEARQPEVKDIPATDKVAEAEKETDSVKKPAPKKRTTSRKKKTE